MDTPTLNRESTERAPGVFHAAPGSLNHGQEPRIECKESSGLVGVGGDSKQKPKAKNRHPMDRATAPHENKFHVGNGADGKHYWLTPPDLRAELQAEFGFDFDACPFPKPADFDGLTCEWGQSSYANIPFGSVIGHDGKKKGPTAWARKAIAENKKGKCIVLLYPIDKWVLMMLAAGAEVRNLGDVKWCATEDGTQGKGTGRHIAAFILHEENPLCQTPTACCEAGHCHCERPGGAFTLRAADEMARIIDQLVLNGKMDARSALADARLNYGEPFKYEFSGGGGAELVTKDSGDTRAKPSNAKLSDRE